MIIKSNIRKILFKFNVTKSLYVRLSAEKEKCIEWVKFILPIYISKIVHPQHVFLVFVPEHGNLGDHAIAHAECRLLDREGIRYIQIPDTLLYILKARGKMNIFNGRIIIVHGGGYLGTLWLQEELILRDIISNNPTSEIFCMPNTIYYENDEDGRRLLEESIKIYNNHKHLHLYAREKTSYDIMSKIYNDVKLVPDMVFSLNFSEIHKSRRGALICFRNDIEQTMSIEEIELVKSELTKLFGDNISITDTVVNHRIKIEDRKIELKNKLLQFMHAELVVTDRLHGMIFSAITGTPCIVFNSRSPKLKGSYDWIKDLGYIRFVDNPNEIYNNYLSVSEVEPVYNNRLESYYNMIIKDITNVM